MTNKKPSRFWVVALTTAFASGVVGPALSSNAFALLEDDRHIVRYPATLCNHDGVLPNFAAGIGNWSGSNRSIFCPLLTDDMASIRAVYLVASANLTCNLKVIDEAGGAWVYGNNDVINQPTYVFLRWMVGYASGSGAALECVVPNGVRVQSYIGDIRWKDWE